MAPTMSSTERPALIDIRYSTLWRPVQIDLRSFMMAMLQLAPATRESLNTEASRSMAAGLENSVCVHGHEQVTARKPGRGVDCRAAPAAGAMADHHVHKAQGASPLRGRAGIIRRTVIDDDDLDRPLSLTVQRGKCRMEAGPSVERRNDHAHRELIGSVRCPR